MDEFDYWSDVARSGRGGDKDRAANFQELFQPISKDYGGLESLGLPEAMELVDLTQDCLDDVWKQTEYEPAYPDRIIAFQIDRSPEAAGLSRRPRTAA